MVFHWSLSDSKSLQVNRALFSILAVLTNAVVWMVSTRPPTFKSSNPFSNPLVYCTKSPNFNSYNCHLHDPQFFQFPSKVEVLIFLFTFFQFYSLVSWDSKSTILQFLFFFCWLLLGLVFWPRFGDRSVCQSTIGVYVCYFLGQMLGFAYTICWCGPVDYYYYY